MCVYALALLLVVFSSAPIAEAQEPTPPPQLVEGGKIYLKNDLQAWRDSMLVFRKFRREFGRLDAFEEVDSREEADLVGVLSGDPDVAEAQGIINMGIPYPSGYTTSKIMILVIFDAKNNHMLWFDAVNWDTRDNNASTDSYERLVKRLKAALDEAG